MIFYITESWRQRSFFYRAKGRWRRTWRGSELSRLWQIMNRLQLFISNSAI